MTPQQRWQKKMMADGRCPICGKPGFEGKVKCEKHLKADRDWKRERAARRSANPCIGCDYLGGCVYCTKVPLASR